MDSSEKETGNRRSWTDEETVAFLKCYKIREFEMLQPRKKMIGYNNILSDLKFLGVLQSETTPGHLQSKMSSLTRAYQRALCVEGISGEGTSSFAYMHLMNDIFKQGSSVASLALAGSFASNTIGTCPSTTDQSTADARITLSSAPATLTRAPATLIRTPATLIRAPATLIRAPATLIRAPATLIRAPATLIRAPATLIRAPATLTRAPSSSNSVTISDDVVASQDDVNESARRLWKYGETRALINCFASRQEESRHPKKFKNLFKNILEDLESMKVLTAPTTASNVQKKWERLLDAYKTASDAETLTGRGSSTFMYMDIMDEIFGERPIVANSHTISLYGEGIQAIPLRPIQKKFSLVEGNDTGDEAFLQPPSSVEITDFMEVAGSTFETIGSSKEYENDEAFTEPLVSKNVLLPSASKNVVSTSSKNVTDPTSNLTTTVRSLPAVEVINLAVVPDGSDFGTSGSSKNMSEENAVASIEKTTVPGNASKHVSKNLPKNQNSTRTTKRVIAGEPDVRSILRAEMGLNDENEPKNLNATQKSAERRSKKLPYSFCRSKTGKEIAQEKKEAWEKEKLKRKNESKMEQIRFMEEKKQKRHEERVKVMDEILKKL